MSTWSEEEARRPFDLIDGPLLRAHLLRLSETEHVLLLTMHHIVSDGWSMGVFVQELAALYDAYIAGRSSPLQELPIQYADFAAWQREGWGRGSRNNSPIGDLSWQMSRYCSNYRPIDHGPQMQQ